MTTPLINAIIIKHATRGCEDSNLKRLSEKKKSEAEAETEWEQVGVKEAEGELEKRKFKKLLKKSLTKKRNCDIIEKLSEKNSEQHLENWTMYEYNTTLEIPFWDKEGKLRKVRED